MNNFFTSFIIVFFSGSVFAQASGGSIIKTSESAQDVVVAMMERVQQSVRSTNGKNMVALVKEDVMPMIAFERMTSASVGPAWRNSTQTQRAELMRLFEALLTRTYAGALTQLNNHTMQLRRDRNSDPSLVRTEVVGRGQPIFIDYRLERINEKWRVINLSVEGIWLVENYWGQFQPEISRNGIDGLIVSLRSKVE